MTAVSDHTVFIVDDDIAVRESLEALADSVGFNVELFGSGQEFLEAYDASRKGCLVLDVRMPELGGLELQRRLTSDGIGIPVILMTGCWDAWTRSRALEAGAVALLEKPFSDEMLIDAIAHSFERRSGRGRGKA